MNQEKVLRECGPNSPSAPEVLEAQLRAYARDFRRLADSDIEKAKRLTVAHHQLQLYARDLKKAYHGEQRRARELEKAYYDSVRRLVFASRYRDQETGKHIDRLSHYARTLAEHLGWQPSAVQLLFDATPMHDVGKIAVPDAVLSKPGPLDEDEWRQMKRHTVLGASLLKGSASPLLELARQIALYHHERWDGSGYPQGLSGEAIPRAARMVMLVDQYDALRSPRSYKAGFSHSKACDVILNGDGRTLPAHFDPELIEAFRRLQGGFKQIHAQLAD
jgi:putative two-component system response regulator